MQVGDIRSHLPSLRRVSGLLLISTQFWVQVPKQKMAVLNLEGSKTQKLYSLRLVLCSDGIVLLRSHSLLLGIVPVCGVATREGGNQDCVPVDGKHVLPSFCTPFSFSAPAVFVGLLALKQATVAV